MYLKGFEFNAGDTSHNLLHVEQVIYWASQKIGQKHVIHLKPLKYFLDSRLEFICNCLFAFKGLLQTNSY